MSILNDYTFLPRDFENMRFNPMAHKSDTNLLLEFSQLQRFRSFNSLSQTVPHLNRNKIIRYICITYDPASPIYMIADEFKKKSVSAALAGIESDPEDGTFDAAWHDMMNCEIPAVNFCILDFLTLFDSPVYMHLAMTYEQFYKKQRLLNDHVAPEKNKTVLDLEKTRGEIWKSSQLLMEELEKLRVKYLRENNPYLGKALYRTISDSVIQKLALSPEAHVKAQEKQAEAKPRRKSVVK